MALIAIPQNPYFRFGASALDPAVAEALLFLPGVLAGPVDFTFTLLAWGALVNALGKGRCAGARAAAVSPKGRSSTLTIEGFSALAAAVLALGIAGLSSTDLAARLD
jgi:hypothetical protein